MEKLLPTLSKEQTDKLKLTGCILVGGIITVLGLKFIYSRTKRGRLLQFLHEFQIKSTHVYYNIVILSKKIYGENPENSQHIIHSFIHDHTKLLQEIHEIKKKLHEKYHLFEEEYQYLVEVQHKNDKQTKHIIDILGHINLLGDISLLEFIRRYPMFDIQHLLSLKQNFEEACLGNPPSDLISESEYMNEKDIETITNQYYLFELEQMGQRLMELRSNGISIEEEQHDIQGYVREDSKEYLLNFMEEKKLGRSFDKGIFEDQWQYFEISKTRHMAKSEQFFSKMVKLERKYEEFEDKLYREPGDYKIFKQEFLLYQQEEKEKEEGK